MKVLAIITGPTAIGKTAAAIEAAKYFNTEIVSADSRQLYKELQIGTAAPGEDDLKVVPHHFIHSHSIHDSFNASRYESEALNLLDQLFVNHDIVVLTGGSMLYIDAVCNGIDIIPDIDPQLREELKLRLQIEGLDSFRLQLKKLDPVYYNQVDLKNPARIVHALEVCLMTGKPYSSFRSAVPKKRNFQIIKTALDCDRADLHAKINYRVDQMILNGLEDEVKALMPLKHLNSLNTVGYRELFDYYEGKISRDKAIELIKRNSRRYARKQLTWFRRDKDYAWFTPQQIPQLINHIETSINNL